MIVPTDKFMKPKTYVAVVLSLLAFDAAGHHSPNRHDLSEPIELRGKVVDFRWTNPHIGIFLTVEDGNGGSTEWYLEGNSVPGTASTGRTRSSSDDGRRLTLEYTAEDPNYLTEPERGIREWEYQPGRDFEDWNCDLESTRRHLKD